MLTLAFVQPKVIIAFFTMKFCRLSRIMGGKGEEENKGKEKGRKKGIILMPNAFTNYTLFKKKWFNPSKKNAYLC